MNMRLQRLSGLRASKLGQRTSHLRSMCYQIDLLHHLVWRDFSLRYKQSVLGILWSLLLPFAQLLVMVFLFQAVVPLNIEAYPAFVFSALLPWNWFSSSLSSACGLFVGNRDLVRHPNFAPARLMLVNTLSNLITYLAALPILIAVLLAYGRPLSIALLTLPLLMLIQSVLTVGLSMVIATLNVFYRDVQHIVVVALMLLFYLTPVFYRPQAVAAQYHLVYKVNPIAVLVQDYRSIFFEATLPSWGPLLYVASVSIVAYGIGTLIYGRQQHDIIDTI
ncbi:MAG TPA: ABC transporter permease [Roseiflexaceae bacterium]|nr:ABC transporter permease [Roseiflexaceae bacterium]